MTPSIRSASRGSARSELSGSRRQLRTRFTTRLESACATYRLRSISYDCSTVCSSGVPIVDVPSRSRRIRTGSPTESLSFQIITGRARQPMQGGAHAPPLHPLPTGGPKRAVDHAARRYGGQLVIAKTSFINFHRSVVTSRPYERNRNLRIDRKDR